MPFPPSHVAGIIAGDGTLSGGHIQGIAPQAFIVSVRVLDAHGKGRLSAMLEGIRWLKENGEVIKLHRTLCLYVRFTDAEGIS